jgi:multidrug efflux system membrane fusion protein
MASVSTEQEPLQQHEPPLALPPAEPERTPPVASRKGSIARKLILAAIILLAIASVIWKVRANQRQQDAETEKLAAAADRPVPVSVIPVQQKNMPIYLTALGTVTAYNTVTIRSRVDGQLMRVNFREGQAVHKGQLLIEIDSRPYQAALEQAQGQLARDQANAKNADAEASRYTALYQAGVVSRESQQAQISTSGQATGTLAADKAAIDAAHVNLAYTRIMSPIDGVVGLRQVDPGNIVHAADTTGLVVVTQLQPISIIFTLPEDYLPQVLQMTRSGKRLTVEAYDRSETTHLASGSLLTVDNQIDTTTGTDKVKAVFENRENTLFPNQFVNVRLILQQRPDALVIPAAAVQTGSQGSFVYVLRDGDPPKELQDANAATRNGGKGRKSAGAATAPATSGGAQANRTSPHYVIMQPIKVDLTEGTQVILAEGLKAGDQIVIDGQERLKNGSRVVPHAAAQRTATPAAQGAASADSRNPATGDDAGKPVDRMDTRRPRKSAQTQHGTAGQQP